MQLSKILQRFDYERRNYERRVGGEPFKNGVIAREFSPDRTECRIIFSDFAEHGVEGIIREEIERAEAGVYKLEWKVYSHDDNANLRSTLASLGFVAGDQESVLVSATDRALTAFGSSSKDVSRIHTEEDLGDTAEIAKEIGRTNACEELIMLRSVLRDTPDRLSVHVAYVDGEPVSSGRIGFDAQ